MTTTSDQFLTADRVTQAYSMCWRAEGSPKPACVEVEAWIMRHTFSVRQLQRHREDIIRMLLALPAGFRSDVGEGGSVGMMIQRGDNTYWTSHMGHVEKLIALGVASGLVTFCAPREKWDRLPGGLPYIRVEITRFGVSVN